MPSRIRRVLEAFRKYEATIALVAALGAAGSASFAWMSNKANQRLAAAQVFLTLRQQWVEVAGQLPERYRDPAFRATEDADVQRIRRYWYLDFDEWFLTVKLDSSDFGELWDSYFKKAIVGALRMPALRAGGCDFIRETTGPIKEFGESLQSLYKTDVDGASPMCRN
jgi:hypothetical protein